MAKEVCNFPTSLDTLDTDRIAGQDILSDTIDVLESAVTAIEAWLGIVKTGTGAVVKATSPVLVTPTLGAASATSINLTGGQIAFPATAAPSADVNTLDDYEEGTFTPGLVCGTSGTITLEGGSLLRYTKIGNVVYVGGRFKVASVDSPVGTLHLSGLPFTVLNSTTGLVAGSIYCTGLAAGSTTVPMIESWLNTTTALISRYLNGAVIDMAADIQANSYISVGLTYFTN